MKFSYVDNPKKETKVTVRKIWTTREFENSYDSVTSEDVEEYFIEAHASIAIPLENFSVIQTVSSGGETVLVGHEDSYYKELEQEQTEQLKEILAKLGVRA